MIIIGLGNPGKEYRETRHNVGFQVVEALADAYDISVTRAKFQALYGEGRIEGHRVMLVRPMTYMNQSGVAVRQILDFYKMEAEDIVVIYDDIDIPVGELRIKKKGSAGTHNGMKSIIQHLGTSDFTRVKIGIGGDRGHKDLADYVLSTFNGDEREVIDDMIELAEKAVVTIVDDGVETAMNEYNGKKEKTRE